MTTRKKLKPARTNLDKEEQALLKSYERGAMKSVAHLATEKIRAKKAAASYLRKDTRINIRLASSDLLRIKEIAAYEGLPYQSLISSVLHKYAAGHLQR